MIANLQLQMPYLHWETDRNRVRIGEIIEREIDKYYDEEREESDHWKRERKHFRRFLRETCLPRIRHDYPNNPSCSASLGKLGADIDATPRTLEDVVWRKIRTDREERERAGDGHDKPLKACKVLQNVKLGQGCEKMKPSTILHSVKVENCRRLTPKHPLAQLLVDAARLFEAITTFQDRQVIESFLFRDPPLHPRRSLDQAYFWKLKTTRKRDRDQVVFRYTQPKISHTFRLSADYKPKGKIAWLESKITSTIEKIWGSFHEDSGETKVTKVKPKHYCIPCKDYVEKMEGWEWSGHGKYEDQHGCRECTEQISRLSRAVMVDQLWMWILDENTILTCFSGRYGAGKNDPSGVHPSIRSRLKDQSNPSNHVRSAFELGLIILEECFDTFFDRAKTPDKRPQVLDMFAESIGRVVCLSSQQYYAVNWLLIELLDEPSDNCLSPPLGLD
jgi:hypothetical protein